MFKIILFFSCLPCFFGFNVLLTVSELGDVDITKLRAEYYYKYYYKWLQIVHKKWPVALCYQQRYSLHLRQLKIYPTYTCFVCCMNGLFCKCWHSLKIPQNFNLDKSFIIPFTIWNVSSAERAIVISFYKNKSHSALHYYSAFVPVLDYNACNTFVFDLLLNSVLYNILQFKAIKINCVKVLTR